MNLILFCVFLYTSLASCILNGQNATSQDQHPFYVMTVSPFLCGGSLLSYDPPYVLTAAHCLHGAKHPKEYTRDKNPYYVSYNGIHRSNQASSNAIIDWTIHPKYNVSGKIDHRYDSAILRLETSIQESANTRRVALWNPSLAPNPTKGELVGFGFLDRNGTLPETLQTLDMEILSANPNGESLVETRTYDQRQIPCHGDSGGPLITYQNLTHPSTNASVIVPFVLGDLSITFQVTDHPNCAIPYYSEGNQVRNDFTNVNSLFDWITGFTGISKEGLTNPFWSPPCDGCGEKELKNYKASRRMGKVTNEHGLYAVGE